ncbi:DUF1572 family protein [Maribacter sp. ANRC-HE7]|uniref:DUF1572 family protein n=1 Tax=Maribacter aquimaris TaxID=2737171 RepID=A0ABR7V6W7_9FLAO|nr:DUF1572 family protein [Maribacter aquimaris]MBD0778893.1 DUF1572 family protein [Maribacter aquimaris]
MEFIDHYLKSVRFEFHKYKQMGDKTFSQLSNDEILWKYNDDDNSVSQIVKHISGNLLSRWTNIFTEDGEKPWRDRDQEFEDPFTSKEDMIGSWENAWQCLFNTLATINATNFHEQIKIRDEEHSLIEAINRQMTHYAVHVGQIVFLGKMIKGQEWISLSIPKGQSETFNKRKFNR